MIAERTYKVVTDDAGDVFWAFCDREKMLRFHGIGRAELAFICCLSTLPAWRLDARRGSSLDDDASTRVARKP